MERQAGLGRSLGDVLDSMTPVETHGDTPGRALFGLGSDAVPATNGAAEPSTTKTKKTKKTKKKKTTKKKSKK